VFVRFKRAAIEFGLDVVIRITSDNPLVDCELINHCLCIHDNKQYDITTTRFIDRNGK